MDRTEQQKTDETPVVSPLAQDKTYGERWYSGIFDVALNYWTNLTVSAGFSQWAEHGTKPVKLPLMKTGLSPRQWQRNIADWIDQKDWFMNGTIPGVKHVPFVKDWKFAKGYKAQMHAQSANELKEVIANGKIAEAIAESGLPNAFKKSFAEGKVSQELIESTLTEVFTQKANFAVFERCMARARSLILLVPGFVVVIPTVWIGAKIKPWFVEKLNKMHYGEDAMNDPSMIARQQAIQAEAKPTLLGTIVARFGTVFAAQAAAQIAGSRNNSINAFGKKHNIEGLENFAIDPLTEKMGETIGDVMFTGVKTRFNKFAAGHELKASENQISQWLVNDSKLPRSKRAFPNIKYESHTAYAAPAEHRQKAAEALSPYSTATQDLGRFVIADTVYTAVTAVTIQPIIRLLRAIPGMSYKPKMPKDSARFEGERVVAAKRIKVPANQYADEAELDVANTNIEPPALERAENENTPSPANLSHVIPQGTLQDREHQIA